MKTILTLLVCVYLGGPITTITENSSPGNSLEEKIKLLEKECDRNNLRCIYSHQNIDEEEDQLYLKFSGNFECNEVFNLMLYVKRKSESTKKISSTKLNIDGEQKSIGDNWKKRIRMGGVVSNELTKFIYKEDFELIESLISSEEAHIKLDVESEDKVIIPISKDQKEVMKDMLFVYRALKE